MPKAGETRKIMAHNPLRHVTENVLLKKKEKHCEKSAPVLKFS